MNFADEILTLLLVGIPFAATVLGIVRGPRWYWLAGILTYIVAATSVAGMLIVSVSFALLALALGHTLGLIRSPIQSLGIVIAGLLVWAITFRAVDDYWLFLPISWLIP